MALSFCPYCNLVAELVGVWDDDESGSEMTDWTCPNNHEWSRPSTSMIIRTIGWGHQWRERRQQIQDNMNH